MKSLTTKFHHRSTLKKKKKPFKGKAKKSSKFIKLKPQTSSHQLNLRTKLDRSTAKKIERLQKNKKWIAQHRLPSSTASHNEVAFSPPPPKLMALISVNRSVQSQKISQWIMHQALLQNMEISNSGLPSIVLPHFAHHPKLGKSQSISLISTEHNLQECLDTAKCADVVVCVMGSATFEDPPFDEFGYQLISALKLQGYSRIIGLCCQIPDIIEIGDTKNSSDRDFARRYFHSEFGKSEKFICIENSNDLNPLLRLFGNSLPIPLSWRKHRGYMLCEEWHYSSTTQQLVLAGHMRGLGFTLQYPVHLTGIGDFVINSIEVPIGDSSSTFPDYSNSEIRLENNDIAIAKIFDQEWEPLRPFNPLEEEQTWPTENDFMINDDEAETNDEQCPNSEDDYSTDILDNSTESRMYESLTSGKHDLEQINYEDLMFTDEVDTPQNQPARVRFQKYRGLKSFKHSSWDSLENLPTEYSRIYDFDSYKSTMKACQEIYERSALDTHLKLHRFSLCRITLNNFKLKDAAQLKFPLILSSLFPYEKKVTVMHFEVIRYEGYNSPIQSKDRVDLSCGFRRFPARPIFSESAMSKPSGQKFKYERFLHPGKQSMLSIYAPCISLPCPVLMFKNSDTDDQSPLLMAWGSLHSAQANRMIIKRTVLTGYPFRTHKNKAVIRFMFFNPEDIRWFRKIELHTKKGLTGHITSSLGTHGYMKCTFNGHITPDDTVYMYLYKRVYPKWFPPSWNGFENLDARTHPPFLDDENLSFQENEPRY